MNILIGDSTLGTNQLAAMLKRPVDGELEPDRDPEAEKVARPGAHFA